MWETKPSASRNRKWLFYGLAAGLAVDLLAVYTIVTYVNPTLLALPLTHIPLFLRCLLQYFLVSPRVPFSPILH